MGRNSTNCNRNVDKIQRAGKWSSIRWKVSAWMTNEVSGLFITFTPSQRYLTKRKDTSAASIVFFAYMTITVYDIIIILNLSDLFALGQLQSSYNCRLTFAMILKATSFPYFQCNYRTFIQIFGSENKKSKVASFYKYMYLPATFWIYRC